MENGMELPQKTKNGTAFRPSDSTARNIPEESWSKNRFIYTMEYYAAERKKELLSFMTAWMKLESIMLSEISQEVKDKYHMISPLIGT